MSTKITSPDNLPKKPGVYIMKNADGEIIYIETEKSSYVDNEYCIDNLISGKKYQIGIFSVSKEDIVTISPLQLIGEPLYLRNEAEFNSPSLYIFLIFNKH